MKCRKCGADLLDTDTFCVKCGQRVDGPMFCASCGEQLRDGERFCHKCGSSVESGAEDDEIPLSRQKTMDIPFDQIEQGILLEAEQAIVKRPQDKKPERRDPEGYRQPGAREPADFRRGSDSYRQPGVSNHERYQAEDYPSGSRPERPERRYDVGPDSERYERADRQIRRTPPPRPREEEMYDEEDTGDSKMKAVTILLGIAVVAIGLVIGFIFWQRSRTPADDMPGETIGQDDEAEGA